MRTNVPYKKLISLIIKFCLVIGLLAAMYVPAGAAVTFIDVSALDATDVTGSGTDDAWNYSATSRTLFLSAPNGEYKLTGTNTDLRTVIDFTATNATVHLSDVILMSNDYTFCINSRDSSITLDGVNTIHCINGIEVLGYNYIGGYNYTGNNVTFNGTGCLTVFSVGRGIYLTPDVGISVEDTATVSFVSKGNFMAGMYSIGNSTIRVATGATLNATGRDGIYAALQQPGIILTLDVDGTLNALGDSTSPTNGRGLYAAVSSDATIRITGTGTVTATGTSGPGIDAGSTGTIELADCTVNAIGGAGQAAINTLNKIKMNNAAKLTMEQNSSSSTSNYNFETSDTTSNYRWKLTGPDIGTTDPLTNDSISVSITGITTGVIERCPEYKIGDINRDGDVNILDLSILLANFGKSGLAITDQRADINEDGDVNILDLSSLLANFGK